ncbi:YhgE/Pip domain-containing protein [soil metagenome]
MSQPTHPFSRTRLLRRIAILAVIVVPLAFAGLFIGALSQADKALGSIPAAIVNNDVLVNQVAADGTKTSILAGRQLVTELTGPKKTGFDWTITNSADAAKALKDGTVYAVLTVPKNFSQSVVSISGDNPVKANISIRTDDAHSYITGAVAQIVGQGLTSALGSQVTKQYIAGLYSGLGTLGSSLGDAADGASSLADGASSLGDGLDSLTSGAASAASGAHKLSAGVRQYTAGVSSLSSGLGKLDAGAAKLDGVSSGVKSYTDGVGTISTGLTQLNRVIQSYPTIDPQTKGAMQQLTSGLATAAKNGPALASGAKTGIDGVQSGIHQSAVGAKKLSAAGPQLAKGTTSLATGLDSLTGGASSAASGATKLASGATKLSDGLASGAKQVPATSTSKAAKTADVASDPVTYSVKTANHVPSLGAGISTLFVPLGLWIGALAVFLVLRPVNRRSLTSTANNRRLVFSQVSRAAIVTVAQAILLTVLIFLTSHVAWSLLPAVLGFSVLMAIAFTAFHYLLTIGLGRGGLIVSLLLLAVQITSTGGLYPVELLAKPFQMVSPFLPLTYGISGMQGILTGGPSGPVVTAVIVLALFAIACLLIALVAIRRTRRATALGLVPATA